MLKNIIVFLLSTVTIFAHTDGSDHWHFLFYNSYIALLDGTSFLFLLFSQPL